MLVQPNVYNFFLKYIPNPAAGKMTQFKRKMLQNVLYLVHMIDGALQAQLKKILFQHIDPKNYTVFVFGSRATGASETFSDIDIGIEGQPLSAKTKREIEEALEESDIPFRVDIVDFSTVNDRFRNVAKQKIIAL
jgi:predicted nucleotidyltransferase